MKKQNITITLALALVLIFTSVSLADQPLHLVIPAVNIDSKIVPVGWRSVVVEGQAYNQWLVDKNFVGWHSLSSKPGQIGNTVLNGHSDIYTRIFRNLDDVQIGDEVIVVSGDQKYRYVITQKIVVTEAVSIEERLKNARFMAPTSDKRLTLITCTQLNNRLIVVAHFAE